MKYSTFYRIRAQNTRMKMCIVFVYMKYDIEQHEESEERTIVNLYVMHMFNWRSNFLPQEEETGLLITNGLPVDHSGIKTGNAISRTIWIYRVNENVSISVHVHKFIHIQMYLMMMITEMKPQLLNWYMTFIVMVLCNMKILILTPINGMENFGLTVCTYVLCLCGMLKVGTRMSMSW